MPILSDFEFDQEGNIILGFSDLLGSQFFSENQLPFADGVDRLVTIVSGGDILRATKSVGGDFDIEPLSTTVATEFFTGDFFGSHFETAQGALAVLPGRQEVLSIALDPLAINTGGSIKLSTTSGAQTISGFQVFAAASGFELKGIGLGDVELMCDLAPLEIGNRVWRDLNDNGVQDPNEPGVDGVVVTLWKDDGLGNFTQISSATTDGSGSYHFNSAAGVSTGSTIFGVSDLLPNMNYELRFPTTATVGPDMLILTTPNNGGGDANASSRDSDATVAGVVPFTTGDAGRNNHNYDVGYRMPPCPDIPCGATTAVKN
jgi:hypothetical protein